MLRQVLCCCTLNVVLPLWPPPQWCWVDTGPSEQCCGTSGRRAPGVQSQVQSQGTDRLGIDDGIQQCSLGKIIASFKTSRMSGSSWPQDVSHSAWGRKVLIIILGRSGFVVIIPPLNCWGTPGGGGEEKKKERRCSSIKSIDKQQEYLNISNLIIPDNLIIPSNLLIPSNF